MNLTQKKIQKEREFLKRISKKLNNDDYFLMKKIRNEYFDYDNKNIFQLSLENKELFKIVSSYFQEDDIVKTLNEYITCFLQEYTGFEEKD